MSTSISAREWIAAGPWSDDEDNDDTPWCTWCQRYRVITRCPACNEPREAQLVVMAHDSMFEVEVREVRRAEYSPKYGRTVRYSPRRHIAVLLHVLGLMPRMRLNTWGEL